MQDGRTPGDDIHLITVMTPVAHDDSKTMAHQPFRRQTLTRFSCVDMLRHRAGFLFNLLHSYNMKKDHKVFKLRGKVQNYAWGGSAFIPGLLGVGNPELGPFAEFSVGAHDTGAAELEEGG